MHFPSFRRASPNLNRPEIQYQTAKPATAKPQNAMASSEPTPSSIATEMADVQILDGALYLEECAHVMAQAFANTPSYVRVFKDFVTLKDDEESKAGNDDGGFTERTSTDDGIKGNWEAKYKDNSDNDKMIKALEWLFVRNLTVMLPKHPEILRGIVLPASSSSSSKKKGKVVCCFLWTPLEISNVSMFDMIYYGRLWLFPMLFGFGSMTRLLDLIDVTDNLTLESVKKHNIPKNGTTTVLIGEDETTANQDVKDGSTYESKVHDNATQSTRVRHRHHHVIAIQLERMVVLPEYQRQGLGKRALKQVIEQEIEQARKQKAELNDKEGEDGLDEHTMEVQVRLLTQEAGNVKFYSKLGFEVKGEEDLYKDDETFGFPSWFMVNSKLI